MKSINNSRLRPTEENYLIFREAADIETSSDDYAQRFSGKIGKYFLETTKGPIPIHRIRKIEHNGRILFPKPELKS